MAVRSWDSAMTSKYRSTILAAALLTASGVFAQINTGRISGSIQDASRAGVPGTTVRAINLQTGVTTTTLSQDSGDYLLNFLVPGSYRIEAERSGFRRAAQTDVVVNAGGIAHVEFNLQVGEV